VRKRCTLLEFRHRRNFLDACLLGAVFFLAYALLAPLTPDAAEGSTEHGGEKGRFEVARRLLSGEDQATAAGSQHLTRTQASHAPAFDQTHLLHETCNAEQLQYVRGIGSHCQLRRGTRVRSCGRSSKILLCIESCIYAGAGARSLLSLADSGESGGAVHGLGAHR
jgi:hypothetical protein